MIKESKEFIKTVWNLSKLKAEAIAFEESKSGFLAELDSKIKAYSGGSTYGGFNRVLWKPFDGERNLGGLGPINDYFMDHDSLRLRGWQLILESEVIQIAIQRYVIWLIGAGLRLNSEPDVDVLKMFGKTVDAQLFSKDVQALWNLWSNNDRSDNSGMETLHAKIYQAEINALIAGDCLMKIDIGDTGLPTVELIDGCHVRSPLFGSYANGLDVVNPDTGNRIRHGIEIDEKGQHVAFYVRKGNQYASSAIDYLNYERIEARDKVTGYVRCFMYYGMRYRQSDIRGIPLIAVCMETAKQLERYKEATVTGAVERAKVAIVLEHELGATGTNPFEANLFKGTGGPFADIPADSLNGKQSNDTFAATTNSQAINTTPGTTMKSIDSKQEIHFNEFFDTNLAILFAAIGMPKSVALMMFDSNYSASRAEVKDWEHTLKVKRKKNVAPAYGKIYNIFLITQVMLNRVTAPGYIQAIMEQNDFVQMAYERASWIGDNPPDIDPLKEVNAARLKLGAGSNHLPFDTFENICRDLGIEGDVRHIFEEYQRDMLYADSLGIEKVEAKGSTIEEFEDEDEDKKKKLADKSGKGPKPKVVSQK